MIPYQRPPLPPLPSRVINRDTGSVALVLRIREAPLNPLSPLSRSFCVTRRIRRSEGEAKGSKTRIVSHEGGALIIFILLFSLGSEFCLSSIGAIQLLCLER
ncbi:hypothetical protein MUK42_07649 [Musa troglodytarum]|uniref:Uncharacterized protein n=1 Tax=Musa troglodytarum TaxID=320322 RepID=A0A9E7JZB6_9LILI|nr:hypothetical protein MUK42_07649 [Musa troglodytarum]